MSAKNIKQFFKEIIATLDDVDQLYIFDLQKQNQIRTTIKSEKSKLPSKLKQIDTSDSMTSNQIVAKVKKFYAN
jgi:hypothetical protein